MTCVKGERDDRCTYEPRQRAHRTNASALQISREPVSRSHHLGVRTSPPKPPVIEFSSFESPIRPSLGTPRFTWSNSSESASSLLPPPSLTPHERPLEPSSSVRGEVALDPSPDLVVQDIHSTTECVPRPTVSSFTVLPSIHFRRIPRLLPVPFSLIPPERVQISSNAGDDLNMTLCVFFGF